MDSSAPRLFRFTRVIVNDHRWQASSYKNRGLKVNAYLTDPAQLEPFHAVCREFLGHAPPTRTTVCVALWGVSLEIDCVAELISSFADPQLRAMVPNVKIVGRALTLKRGGADAIAVNRVLAQIRPGDVRLRAGESVTQVLRV